MTVSGEAFSRRLESYSDDTFRLIMSFDQISKESALEALEIVASTDTEEVVVKKLLELKEKTLNQENERKQSRTRFEKN